MTVDTAELRRLRAYVHDDGAYFTLCPDDNRGDVVLPMPAFHPAPNSDYHRLKAALDALPVLLDRLDAYREALAEIDAELLRYDGLYQDEARRMEPDYGRILQIQAHRNGLLWARELLVPVAPDREQP